MLFDDGGSGARVAGRGTTTVRHQSRVQDRYGALPTRPLVSLFGAVSVGFGGVRWRPRRLFSSCGAQNVFMCSSCPGASQSFACRVYWLSRDSGASVAAVRHCDTLLDVSSKHSTLRARERSLSALSRSR
jgi:hypothetical protein